jgi:hypothetical protein
MSTVQSFTWGSDEGMQALTYEQAEKFSLAKTWNDNDKWSLTPNPEDFKTLINALKFTAENDPTLQSEPAADLLSSIAESLGIEFIR